MGFYMLAAGLSVLFFFQGYMGHFQLPELINQKAYLAVAVLGFLLLLENICTFSQQPVKLLCFIVVFCLSLHGS